MKILIIEDEQLLADSIAEVLRRKGFEAEAVYDGETGAEYAELGVYDLLILDVMMPGLDGIRTTAKLRESCNVPIILLTAKSTEYDKVLGLELGADDYITKPFAMRELMARVKANIRRVDMAPAQSAPPAGETEKRLELGRVSIDLDGATVFKDRKPLDLTQREYELIRL